MIRWAPLPWGLVLFRLVLGPLLLLAAHAPGGLLVLALGLAVLSDIFDGIIARRMGCATPALRQADSVTDIIFWLCVLGTALRRAPDIFAAHIPLIAVLLLAELACQALCFTRFHRPVATHTWFAKSWGLVLFAGFAWMFCAPSGLAIQITCLYGIAVDAEIFAILLRAKTYPVDVKSWRAVPA